MVPNSAAELAPVRIGSAVSRYSGQNVQPNEVDTPKSFREPSGGGRLSKSSYRLMLQWKLPTSLTENWLFRSSRTWPESVKLGRK